MTGSTHPRSPVDRPDRPVFIVGDARSGTTLAYLMLTACPEFARYRAETHLLDVAPVIYGNLASDRKFERFIDEWLASKQFSRSNLTPEQLRLAWSEGSRRYTAMLGRFMEAVAISQDTPRWIEKTPAHVYSLDAIAAEFPDARVLHMIRDPRDVALSRQKLGWVANIGDHRAQLVSACLEWAKMIRAARDSRQLFGHRYREFKYEQLIAAPRDTFADMCRFVGVPMAEEALAELNRTNSAFTSSTAASRQPSATPPPPRWRTAIDEDTQRAVDWAVGETLQELGYPWAFENPGPPPVSFRLLAWTLSAYAALRRGLKHHSPLGRFSKTSLDPVDGEAQSLAEANAPTDTR